MSNFRDMLPGTPQEKLAQLMEEPETQKVFSMLSKNTNGSLEDAADKAANGDTTQLVSAIKQLLQNPDAAKLVQQMKEKLK